MELTIIRRAASVAVWAFGIWLILTWTVTAEQLVTGALAALAVGFAMAPFGDVVPPWRLLDPRRLAAGAGLIGLALGRMVRANLGLAVRIWRPSRPLRSGMIVVPTSVRTDGAVGAVGLITSLIVDNQIVDVDRERNALQYHAISVPEGAEREQINAPIERLLTRIDRRQ